MASQETKIALAKFLDGIGLDAVEKANPTKEVYCRVIKAYGSKPKLYMAPPTDPVGFSEEEGKVLKITKDGEASYNVGELMLLYVRHCIVGVNQEHIDRQREFIHRDILRLSKPLKNLTDSFSKDFEDEDFKKK